MRERILAQRYAEALADVAEKAGNLERMRHELAGLCEATAQSRLFEAFVESGRLSRAEKRGLIREIARGLTLEDMTVRFLSYLIDQRRLGLLGQIAREYSAEADRRLGIEPAEVTTAVELSEGQAQELQARLEHLSGKRIRISHRIDKSLLGGLQVRMRNRFFDGSVRGRLQRLRERMSHAGDAVHTT